MAAAATNFKPFSLEDDAFVQGGLLGDVDVQIREIQWVPWDYGGKSANLSEDVLAVKMELVVLAEDGKPVCDATGAPEPPKEQYWSAGGAFSTVIVSDDGYMCGGTENRPALTKGSNFHFFLQSLRAKGMPGGYLEDGNIGKLKGTRFHLIRTPAPKRDFQGDRGGRGGREEDKTVPVCGSLLSGPQPWGKAGPQAVSGGTKGTGKAQAAAPATTAPAGATADADTEAIAAKLIRETLGAAPNQTLLKLSDLKVQVFRAATKDKTIDAGKRNIIGKLAENGDWLQSAGLCAVMDSGEVTLLPE